MQEIGRRDSTARAIRIASADDEAVTWRAFIARTIPRGRMNISTMKNAKAST